jgi:hypothetical protein
LVEPKLLSRKGLARRNVYILKYIWADCPAVILFIKPYWHSTECSIYVIVASLQAYTSHGIRYYRIVESFRKEGKPSIRVLAHLGRVDEILRRHRQLAEVPVKISSVSAGAVTALYSLARELDLAGQINRALADGGEVQVRAGSRWASLW